MEDPLTAPTLCLIIPVRNGGSDFRRCLAAIQTSTIRPAEFFVVDDGSTDDSARWAAAAGATVLPTQSPGSGPAIGRNLAAQQATADLLYFCDADVEIRPDTLAQIQRIFAADKTVTALFGSYDDQPGDPGFLSQYKNLFHHYVHQQGNDEAATFWSGCGAIRRQEFLQHGGFSSRYALPSIEDIELGYTLKRNGHRIRLDKTLLVKHLKKWTVSSLLHSDIVARGIPWTRLILREGAFLNDLNLQTHNRISVVVVYLLALCLGFGLWQPLFWLGLPPGMAALLYLNRRVYQFFKRKRGGRFIWGVLAVHWLYYFYNGISFGLGALWHVLERQPGKSAPPVGPPGVSVKRVYALPVAALLLLATFLRFHNLGAKSLWLDELLEVGEARHDLAAIFVNVLKFGAMPLDYFVTHGALTLGQQDFWLRVAPAFWSVLTVALIYRFAGRWLGRGVGLIATLLLTVGAFHLHYAQETRPYALFGLWALASFYYLLRALKTNRVAHWVGYALATTLCLFTHYFTLFMIAAQALVAVVWLVRPPQAFNGLSRGLRFSSALSVVVFALALTPTFYSVLDVGKYFALGLAQPDSLTAPAEQKPNKEAGPVLDRAFFEDQLLFVLSGGGEIWRWVFLGLSLGGGVMMWRQRPRLGAAFTIWASVPVVLTVLFLIHRGTFFAVRYITPIYFVLIVFISVALWTLGNFGARYLGRGQWVGWAVVVAIPVAFNLDRVNTYYQTPKEDWRATGQLIVANFRAGDTVDAPLGGGVVFHYAAAARVGRLDTTSATDLANQPGRLWIVIHPYIGPATGALLSWVESQPSSVEFPIDKNLRVFVVDPNSTRADLLAEIKPPDQAITLVSVAHQYVLVNNPAAAETNYRRALDLSADPIYQVAYANFLRQAGRAEEAARYYLAVLTIDSNQTEALAGLGRIYFERGLFNESAAVLERAVTLDQTNYPVYYFLWQDYARLGRTTEAAHYRDLAAQLVPDLIEPP